MKSTIIASVLLGASAICAPMAFLPAHRTVQPPTLSIPIQTSASVRQTTASSSVTVQSTTVPVSTVSAPVSVDKTVTIGVETDGELIAMTLEDYLCGVTAGEMPASFPPAALEAQVIAARTLVLKHLYGDPCHPTGALVCTDYHHCAAFHDIETLSPENAAAIRNAVNATDGQVLMYDGEPITAAFHAISGGMTEASADVWGGNLPYLTNVESPGEENAKNFRTEHTFTASEVSEYIKAAYPEANFSGSCTKWFRDFRRSTAGGILSANVGGVEISGTKLRALLGLPSTDFTVEADSEMQALTFICTGYGHGVGMSQYGAAAYAESGWTAQEIVLHYYPGTALADGLELWTEPAT